MDEFKEVLKIHGYVDSDSSHSSEQLSDFDDEIYNKLKPPPIIIHPSRIFLISPDNKELVSAIEEQSVKNHSTVDYPKVYGGENDSLIKFPNANTINFNTGPLDNRLQKYPHQELVNRSSGRGKRTRRSRKFKNKEVEVTTRGKNNSRNNKNKNSNQNVTNKKQRPYFNSGISRGTDISVSSTPIKSRVTNYSDTDIHPDNSVSDFMINNTECLESKNGIPSVVERQPHINGNLWSDSCPISTQNVQTIYDQVLKNTSIPYVPDPHLYSKLPESKIENNVNSKDNDHSKFNSSDAPPAIEKQYNFSDNSGSPLETNFQDNHDNAFCDWFFRCLCCC